MSLSLEALHKILKDKTRSKIILTLSQKGSLSYSSLMDVLGLSSTGTLNYHLKILGELLTKNQEGHYLLSEKGKFAVQMLKELSKENNNRQLGLNGFSAKNLVWIGVSNGLFLLIMAYFYFTYSIPSYWLLSSLVFFIASIFSMIAFAKLPNTIRDVSPEKRRKGTKYGFTIMGAGIGMFGGIFGGGLLLLGIGRSLRLSGVSSVLLSFNLWVTAGIVVGAIIGGLIGYIVFRRSRYAKTSYYSL
ncbi:MAG: winged helix-turn-helix domain-containing protein [Candidatus Bathyarchaeia archaeon]|jgi:DNA-binding transcriptional ArsR family regulator